MARRKQPRRTRQRAPKPPRFTTPKSLMRLKPKPVDQAARRRLTGRVMDTDIGRALLDPEYPQRSRDAWLRAEAEQAIRLEELTAELRAQRAPSPPKPPARPRSGRPPAISDAEFLKHWTEYPPTATWRGTDPERARLLGISRYSVRRLRLRRAASAKGRK